MLAQGVLDRTLKRISDVLDQQGSLIDTVYSDLARGLKRSKAGRNGMTATQVLRSYILWRIKNWDMRELRERIADGYTTRVFTHFYTMASLCNITVSRRSDQRRAVCPVAVQVSGKRIPRVDDQIAVTHSGLVHLPQRDAAEVIHGAMILERLVAHVEDGLPVD